jgi:hypothetical protein
VGINGNTMPATKLFPSSPSVPQAAFIFYDFELKATEGPIPEHFMHENPQRNARISWGPGYAVRHHQLSARSAKMERQLYMQTTQDYARLKKKIPKTAIFKRNLR